MALAYDVNDLTTFAFLIFVLRGLFIPFYDTPFVSSRYQLITLCACDTPSTFSFSILILFSECAYCLFFSLLNCIYCTIYSLLFLLRRNQPGRKYRIKKTRKERNGNGNGKEKASLQERIEWAERKLGFLLFCEKIRKEEMYAM